MKVLALEHSEDLKRLKTLPHLLEDLEEKIAMEAAAKTLLLGWDGLTEEDGTPIEYTWKKALEYFQSFPRFYTDVQKLAIDQSNFLIEEKEKELGKS